MFESYIKESIVLTVSPIWTGEVDIYDPNTKTMEYSIGIHNKSKEDFQIDKLILRVKKKPLYFSYEDFPIKADKKLVPPNEHIHFTYDLKPIMNSYGDKKRVYVKVLNKRFRIESKPRSIKEMQAEVLAIYKRHF